MSITCHFYIPDITCNVCVNSIKNVLDNKEYFQGSGISIISNKLDHFSKELIIRVQPGNNQLADVKKLLMETIENNAGFRCIDLSIQEDTPPPHFIKRLLTSHWFLGGLGIGIGAFLMIALMLTSGGLALPVMITLGVASSALTLLLGAPFYYNALTSLFYSRTLTMDTLFTISTLTVITVSLASFAFPWLPMMFEAGLLIFGFRHLGIAIENSLSKKLVLEKKFKNRLPLEVLADSPEAKTQTRKLSSILAGERIRLKGGDLIPLDGKALNDCFIYDTIETGSTLPKFIEKGHRLLAGMRVADSKEFPCLEVEATPILLSLEEKDVVPVDCLCSSNDCYIYDEKTSTKQKSRIE